MFDGETSPRRGHLDICREKPEVLTQQSSPSVSGEVSARLGLRRGRALTVQSACTSATQADRRSVRAHPPRAASTSRSPAGADSMMSMFCVAGFDQLGAPLPPPPIRGTASRPFDARRDGFVLGEGSGRPGPRRAWSSAAQEGAHLRRGDRLYGLPPRTPTGFHRPEPEGRGAVDLPAAPPCAPAGLPPRGRGLCQRPRNGHAAERPAWRPWR